MPQISKITLPSGTTYDLKDEIARAAQNGSKVFFGSCTSTSTDNPKIIDCANFTSNDLVEGTILLIFNISKNTITSSTTINVNDTGANLIIFDNNIWPAVWGAGTTIGLVCSGQHNSQIKWQLIDAMALTDGTYGITTLSNKIDGNSQLKAASEKAIKDALDAAKAYADSLDTGVSDVTVAGTSVVTNGVAALGAAAGKTVDTSIAASSTSANLPTSAAVESRIQAAIAQAEVGSAAFQGVINSNTAISGLADYKKGWYWVIGTAGTYVGQSCETGDFVFSVQDRGSAYAASDFKVVQANIDMSQFKALAFKDSATGSVSVTTTGAVTSVSHGLDSATASGTDTVLKDVTNAAPTFTGTQKYLHLNTTKDTVTSTGNFTPAGSVSTPTITVTPNTTTVNSITAVGTLPSATMPVFSATVTNQNLTLGWTEGSFSAGTLPTKGNNTTVVTGIKSATSTQPSFTGTQGSVSVSTAAAVTAISGSVNTTSTNGIDIKPAGSVSAPALTKTYVKPKVTATKETVTSTGTVTVS